MAKDRTDKYGFEGGKMYSHQGARYQYQYPCEDGRLQFMRFHDAEIVKMTVKLAKEYFL